MRRRHDAGDPVLGMRDGILVAAGSSAASPVCRPMRTLSGPSSFQDAVCSAALAIDGSLQCLNER